MTLDPANTSLASQYLIEAGFVLALAACLWHRHWGYGVFLALALAESYEQLRYPFHAWTRDALLGNPPVDAQKHMMQSSLTYIVIIFGVVGLAALTPMLRRASAGRRTMVAGTAIVLAMLAIELISQHKTDAVIYHREGPFARAAIVYFIGAAAIACGALMSSRRKRRPETIRAPHDPGEDA